MRNGSVGLNYKELSTLLSLCGRDRHLRLGSSIHGVILKNFNSFSLTDNNNIENRRDILVVWNSLISMYSRCGQISDAVKMFDRMPVRDTISWNSIISGFLMKDESQVGFTYFKRMLGYQVYKLDHATLTTVLSICVEPEFINVSRMMHALVVSTGFKQEITVGNALITAYFKCGCRKSARKVFDAMITRDAITWTAMVSGLAQSQLFGESLLVFKEMRWEAEANSLTYSSCLQACSGLRAVSEGLQIHCLVLKSGFGLDLCVESALMDMYSKCSMIEDAYQIFTSCKHPDDIFFTVILVGFAQNGLEEHALEFFKKIMGMGIGIDANMISAVLGAFGSYAPFSLGKQIHGLVVKKGLEPNVFVNNGLINMYSKCGELAESVKIFRQMEYKNPVSWNSLIAAFARHGHGNEAFQLYEEMRSQSIEPTEVTFLSLLHGCSHVGSVEEGIELLHSMSSNHGTIPQIEHYACVVDLLGRAKRLQEALKFIESLSVQPKALLWQALLGASSIQGDLTVGRYAAEKLILEAPHCHAAYVLLANIYSSEGRWGERATIIKKMKEVGVKKDVGVSWVEIEKKVHYFSVEDKVHDQVESIYEVLDELADCNQDEEYQIDDKLVIMDLLHEEL